MHTLQTPGGRLSGGLPPAPGRPQLIACARPPATRQTDAEADTARSPRPSGPFFCGLLAGIGLAKPVLLWRQSRQQTPRKQLLYQVLLSVAQRGPSAEAQLRDLWHPEVEFTDPLFGHIVGRDRLVAQLATLRRLTPVQIQVHSMFEDDNMAAAQLTVRAAGPGGWLMELPVSCHLRFEGRQVKCQENYYDLLSGLRSYATSLCQRRRLPPPTDTL